MLLGALHGHNHAKHSTSAKPTARVGLAQYSSVRRTYGMHSYVPYLSPTRKSERSATYIQHRSQTNNLCLTITYFACTVREYFRFSAAPVCQRAKYKYASPASVQPIASSEHVSSFIVCIERVSGSPTRGICHDQAVSLHVRHQSGWRRSRCKVQVSLFLDVLLIFLRTVRP